MVDIGGLGKVGKVLIGSFLEWNHFKEIFGCPVAAQDLVFDDSVRTFLTWWGWVPWVPEIVGSPLMLSCRGEEWLLSCKPVRACRSRQRGMIRTAAWRWLMVGCWFQRCLVGSNSFFWRRTLGGTQLPNTQSSIFGLPTLSEAYEMNAQSWSQCDVWWVEKKLHLPRWWSLFKVLYFLVLKKTESLNTCVSCRHPHRFL